MLSAFLLSFLYLAIPAHEAPIQLAAPVCDDGSSPWLSDGEPNWDCELDGCTPHEWTCWGDRLDFCFDEAGDDRQICRWWPVETCSSRWECFKLWLNCDGNYTCEVKASWGGCEEGMCVPIPLVEERERPRTRGSEPEAPAACTAALADAPWGAGLVGEVDLSVDGSSDIVRGHDA